MKFDCVLVDKCVGSILPDCNNGILIVLALHTNIIDYYKVEKILRR